MPSSSQKPTQPFNRKAAIVDRLTADWGGIDHPLWRKEAADKVQFVIEGLLCIIAMSDGARTPEASTAIAALIILTDWDQDEFIANMDDINEKVMLMNEQEGGMQ